MRWADGVVQAATQTRSLLALIREAGCFERLPPDSAERALANHGGFVLDLAETKLADALDADSWRAGDFEGTVQRLIGRPELLVDETL